MLRQLSLTCVVCSCLTTQLNAHILDRIRGIFSDAKESLRGGLPEHELELHPGIRINYSPKHRNGILGVGLQLEQDIPVELQYEARPDIMSSFRDGVETVVDKRVTRIKLFQSGLLIRQWKLAYEQSPATQRSRLVSVSACDETLHCERPQVFLWKKQAATAWVSHPEFIPPNGAVFIDTKRDSGLRFLDLNGDGLNDLVQNAWLAPDNFHKGAWINNGKGWNATNAYIPPTPFVDYSSNGCPDNGVRFVSLNRDGLTGMLRSIFLKGQGFQSKAWFVANTGWNQTDSRFNLPMPIVNNCQDGGTLFSDLTGDGTDSVVYSVYLNSTSKAAGAYTNVGNGWQPAPQYVPKPEITHYYNPACSDNGVRMIDLNGDGLNDMVQNVWNPEIGPITGAWVNGGSDKGWQLASQFVPPPTIIYNCQDGGVLLVDLNADGLEDIIQSVFFSPQDMRQGAWINTGNGWLSAPQFMPPVVIADYGSGGCPDNGVRLVDLNGDGFPDMVQSIWTKSQGLTSRVWLNTGDRWLEVDGPYLLPATVINDCADNGVRFLDLNGDGLVDVVQSAYLSADNNPRGAWLNSATSGDLLIGIR